MTPADDGVRVAEAILGDLLDELRATDYAFSPAMERHAARAVRRRVAQRDFVGLRNERPPPTRSRRACCRQASPAGTALATTS